MKKTILALTFAGAALLPSFAFAGASTDAALGLGAFAVFNQILGGVGLFGHGPTVAVAAPAPVYVEPAPVVYAPPPPVVYAPPPPPPVVYQQPVVYQPYPVYYGQPRRVVVVEHGRGWERGHWNRGHGHGHDRD